MGRGLGDQQLMADRGDRYPRSGQAGHLADPAARRVHDDRRGDRPAPGLYPGRAARGDRYPDDRLVLGHHGPEPPAGGQAGLDEAGRLLDVDVLRAPQREVVADGLVVAEPAAELALGGLTDVGAPAPGLRHFLGEVLPVLSGPGDQEAPRGSHRQRLSGPFGEGECPGDAAPGEPGTQLVRLDGLEQARRPAGGLRPGGVAFHHHDRPAGQRTVQGGTQAKRTGPDDHDIGVHLAIVPQGFSQTETCWLLSPVKGRRFQSSHRSRSRIPASCAIRSSSAGHTYRNGMVLYSPWPPVNST